MAENPKEGTKMHEIWETVLSIFGGVAGWEVGKSILRGMAENVGQSAAAKVKKKADEIMDDAFRVGYEDVLAELEHDDHQVMERRYGEVRFSRYENEWVRDIARFVAFDGKNMDAAKKRLEYVARMSEAEYHAFLDRQTHNPFTQNGRYLKQRVKDTVDATKESLGRKIGETDGFFDELADDMEEKEHGSEELLKKNAWRRKWLGF
jgi:hypothetical protein